MYASQVKGFKPRIPPKITEQEVAGTIKRNVYQNNDEIWLLSVKNIDLMS